MFSWTLAWSLAVISLLVHALFDCYDEEEQSGAAREASSRSRQVGQQQTAEAAAAWGVCQIDSTSVLN
jgi:hypothetical protein